jgi:2-polyprenyl-3-methyl-5-hydroxy-6-metoxy-1,4-benzoquinol methylase
LITTESHARILEVGFGLGDWLLTLSEVGFEVVGIEISKQAVKLLREALKPPYAHRVTILHGDFMNMDFHEEFDLIFCLEVLEHIQDDEAAIRKLSSFLKPNGKLIISVPAHMKYWTKHDVIAGHYRRYERDELIHKLLKGGFK